MTGHSVTFSLQAGHSMTYSILVLCFFICNLNLCAAVPNINTKFGSIQGKYIATANGYQMQAYIGVPYSQSAPARFSRSNPLTSFKTNPYIATSVKPDCARWSTDSKTMDSASSEDCLYLNILLPANVTCCLPVMFWIQSGGFNDGGISDYNTDTIGDNFVSKGVIVVQVNHRQGPLGFFTTGTGDAMGNYGVWDALDALSFVHSNIQTFGGDPNRTTIMGHESGAVMTELLSLSPLTHGLYSSMLLMDGSAFDPVILRNDEVNVQRSEVLAILVGCDDEKRDLWNTGRRAQVVNCLRNNVTTAQLISAIGREDIMQVEPGSMMCNYFWRPRYDGVNGILPNTFEFLAIGRPRVPVMIGVMQRDWLVELLPFIFEGTQMLPDDFNTTYNTPEFAQQTCETLLSQDLYDKVTYAQLTQMCIDNYANKSDKMDSPYYWIHRAGRIATGYHLIAPMYKSASMMKSQNNWRVYLYSFDYDRRANGPFWEATGAARFQDVALLENFAPTFEFDDDDSLVTDSFSEMLTNFAKFGTPTPSNYSNAMVDIPWRSYGLDYSYMSIDIESEMESRFYEEDVTFWMGSGALKEERFMQN